MSSRWSEIQILLPSVIFYDAAHMGAVEGACPMNTRAHYRGSGWRGDRQLWPRNLKWRRITYGLIRSDVVVIRVTTNCVLRPKWPWKSGIRTPGRFSDRHLINLTTTDPVSIHNWDHSSHRWIFSMPVIVGIAPPSLSPSSSLWLYSSLTFEVPVNGSSH